MLRSCCTACIENCVTVRKISTNLNGIVRPYYGMNLNFVRMFMTVVASVKNISIKCWWRVVE